MGLFTKYREADGETIFTPFGCLLIILLVPLFLILGILSKPFSFLYSNNSGKGSTQNKDVAFDSLVRKRLRANENQYKRRFFNVHNISEEFFFNAKIDYQQVNIPKKMGGVRTLSIPNDELKELQKLLVPIFTKELRKFISKNANAYLYKRSIVTNAEPHLGCKVLIKLDIKDFFKSIKTDQLKPWIGLISYSDEIRHRLLELVHSHELGLPQGAPTSPVLSNLVLKKVDKEINKFCLYYDLQYTRYADDITISSKIDDSNVVRSIIKKVEEILSDAEFQLNKKKGKIHVLRMHQAQRICGVTINSGKPTVSRKQKRLLRAAKHRIQNGKDATFTPQQLAGWDNYINSVESWRKVKLSINTI